MRSRQTKTDQNRALKCIAIHSVSAMESTDIHETVIHLKAVVGYSDSGTVRADVG